MNTSRKKFHLWDQVEENGRGGGGGGESRDGGSNDQNNGILQSFSEPPAQPEPLQTSLFDRQLVEKAGAVSIGKSNAQVTIVKFLDLTCGMCQYAYQNVIPQIKQAYADSGKVRLVFRNFPLGGMNTKAAYFAQAAECAAKQGKYQEFVSYFYEHKKELTKENVAEQTKTLMNDSEKFQSCLANGETAGIVQKDIEDGQKLGIEGTPFFYVNGNLIRGAQPFETFKEAIEKELKK